MASLMVFSVLGDGVPARVSLPLVENSLDEVSRMLPQGLYSTFRTFNNCKMVLGLKAHLDRLYNPAMELGIQPSVPAIELRETLKQLLLNYQPGEARLRISLSTQEASGQIFIAIEPLKLIDDEVYRQGVRVVTCLAERNNPRLKSTTFIAKSAQQRHQILKDSIFEALMVKNGSILEGLTSNFYAVKHKKIITARYGILLGVTRRFILRLARSAGMEIDYRPLRLDELSSIHEAFITSSSRGVIPIREVDGLPVGEGRPGNMAILLRQAYDAYLLNKADEI